MADLSAASLADVSTFFRTYYSPNNASLTLAGDINPAEARKLVEKYFGPIPRGPEVTKLPANVPTLTESSSIALTDAVQLSRTQLVWPTVPLGDQGRGRARRPRLGPRPAPQREPPLSRPPVRQAARRQRRGLPPTPAPWPAPSTVTITPQKGKKLDDLIAIADAGHRPPQGRGPDRGRDHQGQERRREPVGPGPPVRPGQGRLLQPEITSSMATRSAYKKELREAYAVTADDVKRVANKYLSGHRIRLDVNPGPKTPRPEETPVDRSSQSPLAERRRQADHRHLRPLRRAQARPEPRLHPGPGRAPAALQRPGSVDRRAAQPADRRPEPGRQGGRDAGPRRQGRARLAGRRPPDRRDDLPDLAPAGRRAVRPGRLDQRRGRPRVVQPLADDPDPEPAQGPRHLHRRPAPPVLPGQGAGAAPDPAAHGPQSARSTARRPSPAWSSPSSSTASRTPTAGPTTGRRNRSRG